MNFLWPASPWEHCCRNHRKRENLTHWHLGKLELTLLLLPCCPTPAPHRFGWEHPLGLSHGMEALPYGAPWMESCSHSHGHHQSLLGALQGRRGQETKGPPVPKAAAVGWKGKPQGQPQHTGLKATTSPAHKAGTLFTATHSSWVLH